jgi:nitrous oxide reductase accessory protein NosL
MHGRYLLALSISVALMAGCRSERPLTAPIPVSNADNAADGTPVGDDRTAM